MEKLDLLKSLGFSRAFIQKLDKYEKEDIPEVADDVMFDVDSFEYGEKDSTELHIKKKQTSSAVLFVSR